jgi:hypothetical protein
VRNVAATIQIGSLPGYARSWARARRAETGVVVSETVCANCGTVLAGPYCSSCGQHAHESARTVGALLHDAWHVLTHVDGRFWRTMAWLLLRPGYLTREYFAERRARYLPPVRVYLVLSVLFFAFVSCSANQKLDRGVAALKDDPATAAEFAQVKREIAARADAAAAKDPASAERLRAAERRVDAALAAPPAAASAAQAHNAVPGISFDVKECDKAQVAWQWLSEPVQRACRRAAEDGGKSVLHAFGANIPKMMFVFLPLMALVMVLLYWWPRRYYVEHLVFFLHTHAAIFLLMILNYLQQGLFESLPALHWIGGWLTFAGVLYAPWYVYRAMRNYYGQGRWLTLAKLTAVGFAYVVFLGVTLAATLAVSALLA